MTIFPSFFVNTTGGGYEIEQSLRFNSADSAYLNRTPGSAGNRKTWTWSGWVKRCAFGSVDNCLFSAYGNGTQSAGIYFSNDTQNDSLEVRFGPYSGGWQGYLVTAQVFRDPSAWYHIVFVADTTQSTASDRLKLYINGSQVTTFNSSAYPSQNADGFLNQAQEHQIGRLQGSTYYHNGYLAEINFIDGTALDPSSFGEFDNNGVWRPIAYTGSHGTNGFYLTFDPSATNGIGHDHSGNGNNFSPTGFTTSGTGTDVMSDTPTTNYATINPLGSNASSYSEGNLKFVGDTGNTSARGAICTQAVSSGKWYWEVTIDAVSGSSIVGVVKDAGLSSTSNTIIDLYYLNGAYSYAAGSGNKIEGFGSSVTSSSYGNTYTTNDIIGVALDLDNGAIYFAKNGTWQNSGDPTSGSSKTGAAFTSFSGGYAAMSCGAQNHTATFNFGQREFAYPPGTASATDYFNTVTYTGTGGTKAVSGVGFQPDLVWIKNRSRAGSSHVLVDAVRGATKALSSNLSNAEVTTNGTDDFRSFDSDGFTVGDSSNYFVNSIGDTHVAWCFKAGGTAVSNTDGTLTSSVSANQDAGFSIVSYTGNNTDGATIGHGLGEKPSVIIVKERNGGSGWFVYHKSLGATKYLTLNAPTAATTETGAGSWFFGTEPTSSVFTVGANGATNENNMPIVAYCFADVTGVAKHGSYSGTGSTQFIECGFKPAMVIMKSSANAREWIIKDTARGDDKTLEPHEPNNEAQSETVGYQSNPNGFTLVGNSVVNASGDTLIFMAFAENFAAF
jgi:hypothetical protein